MRIPFCDEAALMACTAPSSSQEKKTPNVAGWRYPMTPSAIDVVRAFVAAINRRDPTELSDLMTEDDTFVDAAGTVVTGRVEMATGWGGYFRMFPDYEIRVDHILADGDRVAAFGSAVGTYHGKRGLVPENRIEMPAAWQAVVANGKVRHWQVYADWTEGMRIIDEDRRSR